MFNRGGEEIKERDVVDVEYAPVNQKDHWKIQMEEIEDTLE